MIMTRCNVFTCIFFPAHMTPSLQVSEKERLNKCEYTQVRHKLAPRPPWAARNDPLM